MTTLSYLMGAVEGVAGAEAESAGALTSAEVAEEGVALTEDAPGATSSVADAAGVLDGTAGTAVGLDGVTGGTVGVSMTSGFLPQAERATTNEVNRSNDFIFVLNQFKN
jgi:hypothetical protein